MTSVTFASPLGQAELGPASAALINPSGPADQGASGLAVKLRHLLPSGVSLADDVLARRHRWLTRLMVAHAPVLLIMGELTGRPLEALALALPFLLFAAGAILVPDLNVLPVKPGTPAPYLRMGAICVSTGLAWASFTIITLSGGNLAAHLHLLIMVSCVALYQDVVALVVFGGATALLFEITSAVDSTLLFGHGQSTRSPFVLSAVDLVAVVLVGVALVAFWRATEIQSRMALRLATELELSELAMVQTVETRKAATASLLTHLARRNQSLLARQISQLTRLDRGHGVHGSGVQADGQLQELQHLAGKMRRNAESLLVLSGEEAKGRFGRPESVNALLRRVAQAAPNPRSVELLLRMDMTVAGRASADLAHLLEELLDNAVAASVATGTPVTLEAGRAIDGGYLVVVIDHGVGMDGTAIYAANAAISAPTEVSVGGEGKLGFQVIGRLAARHGFTTSLARGQGGGVVAMVKLPEELLLPSAGVAA